MNFAQILESNMKEKGISAYRLAKDIGVHQTTVKNWLSGREPRAEYINVLASYFDLPVSQLMGWTEDDNMANNSSLSKYVFSQLKKENENVKNIERIVIAAGYSLKYIPISVDKNFEYENTKPYYLLEKNGRKTYLSLEDLENISDSVLNFLKFQIEELSSVRTDNSWIHEYENEDDKIKKELELDGIYLSEKLSLIARKILKTNKNYTDDDILNVYNQTDDDKLKFIVSKYSDYNVVEDIKYYIDLNRGNGVLEKPKTQ